MLARSGAVRRLRLRLARMARRGLRGQRLEGHSHPHSRETMSPCTESHLQPNACPSAFATVHTRVLQTFRWAQCRLPVPRPWEARGEKEQRCAACAV